MQSTYAKDRKIGQRLKQLRVGAEVTQQQLAKAIGVSAQQLQKYESGVNKISASRLEMAAQSLGLPVTLFFLSGVEYIRQEGFAEKPLVESASCNKGLMLAYLYEHIEERRLQELLLSAARHFYDLHPVKNCGDAG